ncbi:MAG: MarR family winged helix-turn-helix transcriptional regulator [Cypionkella sp.]|jgi:DNA-binding MarR family transcriptional regulator
MTKAIPTPTAALPIETVRQIRDECLCLAAQRAARLLARRFDRLFAPLGLTNGQFSLMVALSGEWQPRLGELAQFLAMDSTTVTAAIKTLGKSGFVELLPDEHDARARRPALTVAGHEVLARATPLWITEHKALAAEIDTDAKALVGALAKIG